MRLGDAEYLILRLIRRYLFSRKMLSCFAGLIPYYKSTTGEKDPVKIADKYTKYLSGCGTSVEGKRILEIGIGATNGSCYDLVFRGARICYGYEPHIAYDKPVDKRLIQRYPHLKAAQNAVKRLRSLKDCAPGSVDLVLSHSVLEHIEDTKALFRQVHNILTQDGSMMHSVDYRDHFFKYPFNFYKFSRESWKRIDPGLSRQRISDHLAGLNSCGFEAVLIDKQVDRDAFLDFKKKNVLHADFSVYSDEDLATLSAVFIAKKRKQ